MQKKNIIIFIPSIEGGGVEKNLFLIANHLANKFESVTLITSSYQFKKKFQKKINFVGPKVKFLEKMNRLVKYIICSVYLILEVAKKKNITVFSFQGNLFAIIISKLFCVKVAARANSAPSGWIKNSFKKKIFKFIYSLSNIIIVNSLEFQKDFKTLLNIKSECIYNPLDKNRILKLSKKKFERSIQIDIH